jgi:hypothetical protein
MKLIRKKLTYANVMSTLAVFLVLGGGAALAANQLAKNSVGTKQLKKNAVTTAKVKNGAIKGAKVADGSLTGTDVADGSIGTNDLADLAVTAGKLAADSVDSGKVKDKSLKGGDVADDSLTGTQINEGTLKGVDAATLGGKSSTQFLSSEVYKNESAVEAGQTLGDETQVISEACNPGDVLLSGGPANIAKTTTLLESFPSPGSTNSWTARVNKNAQTDNFSVVVLCVKQ